MEDIKTEIEKSLLRQFKETYQLLDDEKINISGMIKKKSKIWLTIVPDKYIIILKKCGLIIRLYLTKQKIRFLVK